jgi:hypothetical protein
MGRIPSMPVVSCPLAESVVRGGKLYSMATTSLLQLFERLSGLEQKSPVTVLTAWWAICTKTWEAADVGAIPYLSFNCQCFSVLANPPDCCVIDNIINGLCNSSFSPILGQDVPDSR